MHIYNMQGSEGAILVSKYWLQGDRFKMITLIYKKLASIIWFLVHGRFGMC